MRCQKWPEKHSALDTTSGKVLLECVKVGTRYGLVQERAAGHSFIELLEAENVAIWQKNVVIQ